MALHEHSGSGILEVGWGRGDGGAFVWVNEKFPFVEMIFVDERRTK